VPLTGPLTGNLVRTWTGSTYALALPTGQSELALTLMPEPAGVSGVLREVSGGGSTSLVDGMPGAGTGQLGFTLGLTALTQPVVQRHRLTWRLVPYQAPPAP